MKLKDLLKKDNSKKLNEAGLASYYNRAEAPVKSAAKKVEQMLNDLIKDKEQMAKLIDAITDLADEYAQERIDNLDSERN
jgi:UDP-N-acetylglucosamine:LPS N-acetylglucosamine transferase